eukprot:CAMPEP_0167747532 /NCGR_PEP_ID=MMETSP0110_2-20121227/4336_1 /TAXON_ID=629695 /ORGANISM="Gymnochlora sp., Strain CCMP2014" /LENGTH=593 /DNA_ID=CAMNT_0007632449 /DNA_START=314 /DNA_END=2095 /DNA_ORIENTATION=+
MSKSKGYSSKYVFIKDHSHQTWELCKVSLGETFLSRKVRAVRLRDGKTVTAHRSRIRIPPELQGELMASVITKNTDALSKILTHLARTRRKQPHFSAQPILDYQDPEGRTGLFRAAQLRAVGVMRMLLAQGANVSIADQKGATPLDVAANHGDLAMVRTLVDFGADVNKPRVDSQDSTYLDVFPLFMAAQEGHASVCRALLDLGADPNRPRTMWHERYGRQDVGTSLYIASHHGHADVVKVLLEAGAEVDKPIQYGTPEKGATPLLIASIRGHTKVVKQLLASGADPQLHLPKWGTPLHAAAQLSPDAELARVLLQGGANVTKVNSRGETAMHMAALSNHYAVAEELVEAKTLVNAQSTDGSTPLFVAAQNGNMGVLKLLLSNGADTKIATYETQTTPLLIAVKTYHSDIALELLSHGSDPTLPNSLNETPLRTAVFNGMAEFVAAVKNRGFDIRPVRHLLFGLLYQTPNESPQMLRILLDQGADPSVGRGDLTPLMLAAMKGWDESVKILLEYGSDARATNQNGRLALHYAAERGELSIVERLVAAGSDAEQRDQEGRSALTLAKLNKHADIVTYLSKPKGVEGHRDSEGYL